MMNISPKITLLSFLLLFNGCTTLVTAPIEVAGSVASAGISMAGAAGGAVVDIATGGDDDDEKT